MPKKVKPIPLPKARYFVGYFYHDGASFGAGNVRMEVEGDPDMAVLKMQDVIKDSLKGVNVKTVVVTVLSFTKIGDKAGKV